MARSTEDQLRHVFAVVKFQLPERRDAGDLTRTIRFALGVGMFDGEYVYSCEKDNVHELIEVLLNE